MGGVFEKWCSLKKKKDYKKARTSTRKLAGEEIDVLRDRSYGTERDGRGFVLMGGGGFPLSFELSLIHI